MIFRSLCSGIEAASVAWHPLGWRADAVAEVEPFPCFALAHHYGASRPWRMPDPDQAASLKGRRHRAAAIKAVSRLPEHGRIPNLGDITQYRDWPDATFDLLVGGTPCQSFSIAGLRKGLDDPRGNLTLVYLGILDRFRPRWMVWENVPGVLSDKGNAFGAFLGGLAELGYGFAYRILDAQFFGVPQRRRRVFVVGHSGGLWQRCAAVLFEPEGLRGDHPPRREAGKDVAGTLDSRTSGGGGLGTDFDCDGGLIAFGGNNTAGPIDVATAQTAHGGTGRIDFESETFVAHALRAEGFDASEDGTGRGTPIVPICFSSKDYGADAQDGIAPTLRAMGHAGSHANAGGQLAVAFDMRGREGGSQFEGPHETANIRAASGGSSRSYVAQSRRVRRLMPVECERLQGFPDGYTDVPYGRRNRTPDGPRYKALGNSFAVSVVRWIGRRIEMVESMASERVA